MMKEKDFVMFGWSFNGGVREGIEPTEVIVSRVSTVKDDKVLVGFTYGHHSISEWLPIDKIIAVGDNENGSLEVLGWGGKYRIIDQEKVKEYTEKQIITLK